MPSNKNPGDWDRLFAPNAPKRGGPLSALLYIVLFAVLAAILIGGGTYAVRTRQQQIASAIATATAFSSTVGPQLTSTIVAEQTITAERTATRIAMRTATAQALAAPTGTPAPTLGDGQVLNGGNLRSEPRIAPETVVGLIYPGDTIVFLEQQTVGDQLWLRIRVVQPAADRIGEGAPAGAEGWASATLLSPLP